MNLEYDIVGIMNDDNVSDHRHRTSPPAPPQPILNTALFSLRLMEDKSDCLIAEYQSPVSDKWSVCGLGDLSRCHSESLNPIRAELSCSDHIKHLTL